MIENTNEIENKPFFLDSILQGDALEQLELLPDNCIDTLVCDPPAGISFMNREFDSNKGGRDKWINWLCTIMKEVYRVLKPGSYGLIWSLPRTSHWTATALENAGFEIRDSISHLYAPDSKIAAFYSTLSHEQLNLFEQVLDSADTSSVIFHVFGSGFPKSTSIYKQIEKKYGKEIAETKRGLGSALKPAYESWLLVRKPLSEKTLADNVLKWGTGGLSIDASRIPTTDKWTATGKQSDVSTSLQGGVDGSLNISISSTHENGRWPSHLLLSHHENCVLEGTKKIKHNGGKNIYEGDRKEGNDYAKIERKSFQNYCDENYMEEIENWHCVENLCPVWILNQQSGESKSTGGGGFRKKGNDTKNGIYGIYNERNLPKNVGKNDTGGASRYFQTFPPYFYAAKASKSERNAGCDELEKKNNHITVKNLKLMSYLINLITPEDGIVLDCFAGSGSTLVAAIQNNYHFIGIEKEAEYIEIARARIEFALNKQQLETN